MIPSTQEIKKEIHKHEYRNIQLIFEPGKTTITQEDEALPAGLIKLSDFELEMRKTVDQLYKDCIPVDKMINALRDEFAKVNATFNTCVEMADKLADTSYVVTEASIEKLTQGQIKTNEEIQRFHAGMTKVFAEVQGLEKRLEKYYLANEDESNALYDEYSEIVLNHSHHYEINSINIVDFDDEYNNFLEYRGSCEDRRKTLLDYCDEVLENYTRLNLENTTLYNVWAEFLKRCDLLRKVAVLHSGVIGGTYN
jgi:hypothetical protein